MKRVIIASNHEEQAASWTKEWVLNQSKELYDKAIDKKFALSTLKNHLYTELSLTRGYQYSSCKRAMEDALEEAADLFIKDMKSVEMVASRKW